MPVLRYYAHQGLELPADCRTGQMHVDREIVLARKLPADVLHGPAMPRAGKLESPLDQTRPHQTDCAGCTAWIPTGAVQSRARRS